jgi:hypothetical protein
MAWAAGSVVVLVVVVVGSTNWNSKAPTSATPFETRA